MALTRGGGGSFRWAVAERPGHGGPESGDAYIVVDRDQGPLVAVVDGLGRGREAARAARTGIDAIRRNCDESLVTLFARCASAVAGTRGLVATVCSIDAARSRLTWSAIGNVAGMLVNVDAAGYLGRREVIGIGGIVGPTMPTPCPATVEMQPRSLLVMATDGIAPRFREALDHTTAPDDLADRILSSYGDEGDDALILVGRYEPEASGEDHPGGQ